MSTFDNVKAELLREPKTWLVTGVAGFIGSNILEELLRLKQTVVGLDNFSTGYQRNIDEVLAAAGEDGKRFRMIKGDVQDLATCLDAAKGVDCILHQAALGSVPQSMDQPTVSNASNVTGALNILVAAKECGVKGFVYASSSAVYGDEDSEVKVEAKIGNALSPYAVTKRVNELYADVFARSFGVKSVGLRYFNVFGPRQDPAGAYAAVIPLWVKGVLTQEPIFLNGDGSTGRDFCYVDNVVQANILAATTRSVAGNHDVFNVAFGQKTTLNGLFESIRKALVKRNGRAYEREPVKRDFRAGDVYQSHANISKARSQLGYEPAVNLTEGLDNALGWYIDHV